MPEVLVEYRSRVVANGVVFRARACGSPAFDRTRRWQGWVEFVPEHEPGAPICTGPETTQPNRTCLVYWATGLQPVFLEGALRRALDRPVAWAFDSEPFSIPRQRSKRRTTLRFTREDRLFLKSIGIASR